MVDVDEASDIEFPIDAFSAATAKRALIAVCETAELDADSARLVRLGENAVFQLAEQPVIVRIARSSSYLPEVQRGVDVARWLDSVGFPAVRLVDNVQQPLIADGRVATFWQVLSGQDATAMDLAGLLRQLHALEPPGLLVAAGAAPT